MAEDRGYLTNDTSFATRAIHEGNEPEQWRHMSLVPPITMSTSFKQDGPAQPRFYEYSRTGNPTRDCLEKCLASIDNAKFGLLFSSGSAATTTITHLLSAGDHVVSMDDLYGGTSTYFRTIASRLGIKTDFVDATDPENVEKAIKPNTKMLWFETPTNPTMKLVDIAAIASIAKNHEDCFMVIDNTFMSPYFQRPLDLGADLVMSSATKYINGHTDVIMGAVTTNREDLHTRLRYLQNAMGCVPSPFDCYLVNRSVKTLAVRMKQHMENGLAVANFLKTHPCVEKVMHPGLPSHPQHELSKRQCFGHSGMLAFCIKGNDVEVSKKFFKHLKVFSLAESLGGCESVCKLPSRMPANARPQEVMDKMGLTDGLIRVSCGLENAEDLIRDLDQALRAAATH